MAAKLMEILEYLREEWSLTAWIYGDLGGWKIKVILPYRNFDPDDEGSYIYIYPVEPGIVSPYRSAADVAREIAEEVKSYGKS
mgnify:CR=1 FL=1